MDLAGLEPAQVSGSIRCGILNGQGSETRPVIIWKNRENLAGRSHTEGMGL
jgi:hypothetical protein